MLKFWRGVYFYIFELKLIFVLAIVCFLRCLNLQRQRNSSYLAHITHPNCDITVSEGRQKKKKKKKKKMVRMLTCPTGFLQEPSSSIRVCWSRDVGSFSFFVLFVVVKSRLMGPLWHSSPFCKLYKTLKRPHLQYGNIIWYQRFKKDIEAIEKVQ